MPSQKKLYTERVQVMLIVSNRLRTALQIRNLSQKQFAQKLGITEVTTSRYINGTRTPNANVIAKICYALNISSDWLLGLSKEVEMITIEQRPVVWLELHDKQDDTLIYINSNKICGIYNDSISAIVECDNGIQYRVRETVNEIIGAMILRENG